MTSSEVFFLCLVTNVTDYYYHKGYNNKKIMEVSYEN